MNSNSSVMTTQEKKIFTLKKVIRAILIVIVLFIFLFPVIFIVGGSFKTQREFYITNPSFFPRSSYREQESFSTVIPEKDSSSSEELGQISSSQKSIWFNYTSIFARAGERVKKGIIDSFIVGIVSTILAMLISVPAAYTLARYKPGGTQISFFILSILFLPPIVGVLPLFFIFKRIIRQSFPVFSIQ